MPNTNVIRRDVQVGTIGASMGSTQTSINLGAAPSFPTLVSSNGDYIPLTLVNTGSIPLSEIVYLTSYSSGDSTGGIVRGQETASGAGGSTTWAAANTWLHAPTAFDLMGPNAWQLAGNTAGTMATLTAGTVTLAGGNSITLSQAGNAVTISGPSQSVQSIGLYALSNTTSSSSSTTLDARTLSFNGMGAVSVGFSAGSIVLSAPNTIAQTNQSLGIYASSQSTGASSSSTYDARTLTIVAQGALSAGWTNGSFALSAQTQSAESQSFGASNLGNTLGTSGIASGAQVRMLLAATNWLSLSQSVNGASATITISPGGYVSQFAYNTEALYSSSTNNMANTSVSFLRMQVPHYVTVSRVDMLVSISAATSGATNTAGNRQSWVYALYTRNANTLTPIVGGSSSKTYTWASNTGMYSSLTGARILSFALATALTPGEYFLGVQGSSSTYSDTNAANTTALSLTIAPVVGTQYTAVPWQDASALTAATVNPLAPLQGMGSVSLSLTNQTYQASDITMTGAVANSANIIAILRNV